MTDTLRDLLRQDADNVETPTLDANDVIMLGEQRLHRRRMTAALAAGAAVAVIAVSGIVAGSVQHQSQGPVDKPTKTDKDQRPAEPQTRKIVYSDDLVDGRVGTLHVGDREVEINQELQSVRSWSMFVTDAGAVYAQDDHSVWFTDGGRPRKIASHSCAISAGDYVSLGLATGNAGPLVAWFDCEAASRGDLVVYDTSLGREVARHPVPSCTAAYVPSSLPWPGSACVPDALVGQHVYFGHFDDENELVEHQFRFDVTSGQVLPVSPKMYAQDVSSHPRGLVVGDAWQTGTAGDGIGQVFHDVGTRLHLVWDLPNGEQVLTKSFDTATGHAVRLHLPAGYHADPNEDFTLFEWLDDDTVALVAQFGGNGPGDILTCHLSDGRCDLAVKAGPPDKHRIVAGGSLPG